VGGLSVLVRGLLTLKRAGVRNLIVIAEGAEVPLLEDVRREGRLADVRFLTAEEASRPEALAGGDFLILSADRVFSKDAVENLLSMDPPDDKGVWIKDKNGNFSGLALCPSACVANVSRVLGEPGPLANRLEKVFPSAVGRSLTQGFMESVKTEEEARQAEERLVKALGKDTDSFLARHIDRHISLAITRRLARTQITANQVTLLNFFVGLVGAALFAQPNRWLQVLGAFVFLFSSTVDGCDGEIARLKFQQSQFGGWLDIMTDNLVHVAVFGAIAIGLYREDPADRFIWLGVFSCLGVLLSAGMVSWKVLRFRSGEGNFFVSVGAELKGDSPTPSGRKTKRDWLREIDDHLARRDFIYLLIPLAAFGLLEWFLWASAIGGNLFFLSLLFLYSRANTGLSTIH
jgi:phosphatidylglycerophosphate synthase